MVSMLTVGGKQILQHTLSYRNWHHGCRDWNTGQGDSLIPPLRWTECIHRLGVSSDREAQWQKSHSWGLSALSDCQMLGRWMQDQSRKSRVSCFSGNEYKPFLPGAEAGMKCSETIETSGQNLLKLIVVAPSFFFSSEMFASFGNSLK